MCTGQPDRVVFLLIACNCSSPARLHVALLVGDELLARIHLVRGRGRVRDRVRVRVRVQVS